MCGPACQAALLLTPRLAATKPSAQQALQPTSSARAPTQTRGDPEKRLFAADPRRAVGPHASHRLVDRASRWRRTRAAKSGTESTICCQRAIPRSYVRSGCLRRFRSARRAGASRPSRQTPGWDETQASGPAPGARLLSREMRACPAHRNVRGLPSHTTLKDDGRAWAGIALSEESGTITSPR